MGFLDNIISQVLNQPNSPLVADLEKVATDAIATGNKPATTTPANDPDAEETADTNTANTDTTNAADPGADAPDTPPPTKVDVAAMLDGLQDKADGDFDWRKSIVDLLKLLGQDSSLSARKQLADELNYDGDTDDTATMNVWLHKEVMKKLAENGGKLPDDL